MDLLEGAASEVEGEAGVHDEGGTVDVGVHRLAEHWFIGSLVHWCIGALVHWCIGAWVHWRIGAMVGWSRCGSISVLVALRRCRCTAIEGCCTSIPVSGGSSTSRSCGYWLSQLRSAPRSTMPICIPKVGTLVTVHRYELVGVGALIVVHWYWCMGIGVLVLVYGIGASLPIIRLHLEDGRAGALAVGHPSGRCEVYGLRAVRRGRAEAVLDAALDAVLVGPPELSGQHAPRQAAVDLVRVRDRVGVSNRPRPG